MALRILSSSATAVALALARALKRIVSLSLFMDRATFTDPFPIAASIFCLFTPAGR